MSGGVDSAVATSRLVKAGHEVTGVHLTLHHAKPTQSTLGAGCGSASDLDDAKHVADQLGIPFLTWDFSDLFASQVVDYFLDEYASGRTPNPCLRCNERIKFQELINCGLAAGFDAVATGHYARVVEEDGYFQLYRAKDQAKDQSYVLGVLTQDQLAHAIFPLGQSLKSQIRAEAQSLGFEIANKPESMDICFIPDGDTADFLSSHLGSRPGQIVDVCGKVLGNHDGTYRFTVGQRKGLNLGVPAVDGKPRYVAAIEPDQNRVVVGGPEDLYVSGFSGVRLKWTVSQPAPWHGLIQYRAHSKPVPGLIAASKGGLEVTFETPVRSLAPGQYAVFYDGHRVVGSAVIAKTRRTS